MIATTEDRHAYLIIAHTEPEVLSHLLASIDDERNDIFVHIDKKAKFSTVDYTAIKSKVYIIPDCIDAAWGDFSLVEIELKLIATALNTGHYSYLHLLSGVDLPIKTQNFIHEECRRHYGKQFIGISQQVTLKELNWRSQHYFFYPRDFKDSSFFKSGIRYLSAKIQSFLGYKRYRKEVKKGSQWWSITYDFAVYVLSQKELIENCFKNTFCPDEMVFQTLCWNSQFRNDIFDTGDEFHGCKRYIPWKDGVLMELKASDYLQMKYSEAWFARKFSQKDLDKYDKFSKSLEL